MDPLQTLTEMLPVEASRVDVYRLGPGFTGATERDDVPPEAEEALRHAEQAHLLIAAAHPRPDDSHHKSFGKMYVSTERNRATTTAAPVCQQLRRRLRRTAE